MYCTIFWHYAIKMTLQNLQSCHQKIIVAVPVADPDRGIYYSKYYGGRGIEGVGEKSKKENISLKTGKNALKSHFFWL